MTFTPKIANPNKYATPATEIRLKDRLVSNDQLTDFFNEIPKRIEIVEKADDTSNNLDVLALVDDLAKCITDVGELQESIETLNESTTELQEIMGQRIIHGTVQYRLNEVWDAVFNADGGIIWMCTEFSDDLVHIQNTTIPEFQNDLNQVIDTNTSQWEYLTDHEKKINAIDNKLTQIDVNTADMKVVQAQVISMQAQIEQIRTECNNNIANCMNAIEALTEKVDFMKLKLDQL